jgi:hypothetical protein
VVRGSSARPLPDLYVYLDCYLYVDAHVYRDCYVYLCYVDLCYVDSAAATTVKLRLCDCASAALGLRQLRRVDYACATTTALL